MKLAQNWAFPHAALAGLVLMWLAIGLSYYLLLWQQQACLSALPTPSGRALALFWYPFPVFSS